MSATPHIPILTAEVLELISPRPGGVYCDGTLGGGGHTRSLLQACGPDGVVVAIDRDRQAIERARRELSEHGDRLRLVHGRFGDVAELLDGCRLDHVDGRVDGFVLDLGLSSIQLDDPARGFSFHSEEPPDMRMDQSAGHPALDLVRTCPPDHLAELLRSFGEERFARRIASQISEAARRGEIHSAADLGRIVAEAIPAKARRGLRIHPATRTFQALRIAVNDELGELERFLAAFPDRLAAGGRCAIISFHSLEDRMVKRRFRQLAFTSSLPPDLARQAGEPVEPVCRVLTRKPIAPGEAEVGRNPRARSARLRACEKVATTGTGKAVPGRRPA